MAKDLYWTIPNGFGAAAVKRHAAKIQEKFTVRRALRQPEGFLWHSTSRLAAYDV